jgi:hypothetical protein
MTSAAIGIRFAPAAGGPADLGEAATIDWPHAEQIKAPAARPVPHFGHVVAMGLLLGLEDQLSPWVRVSTPTDHHACC